MSEAHNQAPTDSTGVPAVEAGAVTTAAPAPAAPVAEPIAAEPPPSPVNEPSLLETATAQPAAAAPEAPSTPVEAPKPEEAAPEAPAEAPALTSIEYKYELPETITLDEATRDKFHAALDAFRGEGHSPQELIALHNEAMTNYDASLRQQQWDTFNGVRKGWRESVMADEEIGGSGHQTAMTEIARVRDALVKPSEIEDFNKMLAGTGVGDHPLFLKLLHRAARYVNEGAMPPPGAKPAPNNGQSPKRTLRDLYK